MLKYYEQKDAETVHYFTCFLPKEDTFQQFIWSPTKKRYYELRERKDAEFPIISMGDYVGSSLHVQDLGKAGLMYYSASRCTLLESALYAMEHLSVTALSAAVTTKIVSIVTSKGKSRVVPLVMQGKPSQILAAYVIFQAVYDVSLSYDEWVSRNIPAADFGSATYYLFDEQNTSNYTPHLSTLDAATLCFIAAGQLDAYAKEFKRLAGGDPAKRAVVFSTLESSPFTAAMARVIREADADESTMTLYWRDRLLWMGRCLLNSYQIHHSEANFCNMSYGAFFHYTSFLNPPYGYSELGIVSDVLQGILMAAPVQGVFSPLKKIILATLASTVSIMDCLGYVAELATPVSLVARLIVATVEVIDWMAEKLGIRFPVYVKETASIEHGLDLTATQDDVAESVLLSLRPDSVTATYASSTYVDLFAHELQCALPLIVDKIARTLPEHLDTSQDSVALSDAISVSDFIDADLGKQIYEQCLDEKIPAVDWIIMHEDAISAGVRFMQKVRGNNVH